MDPQPRSIVARLVSHAASQPEAPAYIEKGRTLSYRTLAAGAERAAVLLSRHGVRAGDTVALAFEQSDEDSLYLLYGLAWLGAIVVPLHPETPRTDWESLAQRYGARILDPKQLAALPRTGSPPRADASERPFIHLFSSGTTGEPKAALFTHGQLAERTALFVEEVGWRATDRMVPGRPWPAKVGLHFLLLMHSAGGALVNEQFPASRAELAALMRGAGVTGMAGSPAAMRRLLATALPPGERLPELRVLCFGGAASSPEEIGALRREITPNVFHVYASTESGLVALLRPGDPPDAGVGRAVRGIEVRVDDDGRIGLRAPWIPQGYPHNAAASERHFRDGWFYPGDLGAIDPGGWIRLEGRDDDVINFSGVKILPQEIEAVLLRHPDVADAAVLGVPSERTGQMPVAFFVPRGASIDWESLRSHCFEQCGPLRRPARFLALKRLPRNAAGKILRRELLALYEAALAEQGAPRKV